MTTFNPRNWPRLLDWLDSRDGHRNPSAINRDVLQRWCMEVAFCLCFAGLARPHLIPFVFIGLLFLAGVAWISIAVLRGDHPLAAHLTAWDEAALLFALSLGLRLWLGPTPVS